MIRSASRSIPMPDEIRYPACYDSVMRAAIDRTIRNTIMYTPEWGLDKAEGEVVLRFETEVKAPEAKRRDAAA